MGAGMFGAVIRFILHVPLAMWAFDCLGYYYLVRDHPAELQNELYNPLILSNLRIAGIGGVVLWVWNFVLWIPTGLASGIVLLLIAAADVGFTVLLGFVVSQQALYVPHSKTECGEVAPTFQVPASNASFFQAAGALNGTGDAPVSSWDVCNNFVDQWALGAAILILMGLLSLSNLVGGAASLDDGPKSATAIWGALYGLGRLVVALLTWFPFWAIATGTAWAYRKIVPLPIRNRLLFVWRYLCKYLQRLPLPIFRRPKRHAKKPWTPRPKLVPPPGPRLVLLLDEKASTDPLARNLLFDVLALVARDLHYIDLQNLGLTSRSLREAVFPANDAERRRLLRGYSCRKGHKTRCWGCGLQVCNGCSLQRRIEHHHTPTAYHLRQCRPTCSDCLRAAIERHPPSRSDRGCTCIPSQPPRRSAGSRGQERAVCRDCAALSDPDFFSVSEERATAEVSEMLRRPLACRTCEQLLPEKGVRWWVCSRCAQECRKRVHHGWTKKPATMDV